MKRWRPIAVLVISAALIWVLPPVSSQETAEAPTLEAGMKLQWSYTETNFEGTFTRTGDSRAEVKETTWRGLPVFLLEGNSSGTVETDEASGTETSTFKEYYRKADLALMDIEREADLQIAGHNVNNITRTSYSPPYRWIEFPLSFSDPRTIWEVDDQTRTVTWEEIIDGDDSTLRSGSNSSTYDFRSVCANIGGLDSTTTDAGTFDTFRINEMVIDEDPSRRAEYHYSGEAGWWVKKDLFESVGQTERRVEHYELTEYDRNEPPVVLQEPAVTMDEDTVDTSTELSDVFSDPDGDPLQYSVSDTGVLSVEITPDDRVRIVPPANESGTWIFNISADDGKNPKVSTELTVEVLPVDDPPILSSGRVFPLEGDFDDTYTIEVELQDVEGDIPSSRRVHIDGRSEELLVGEGDPKNGLVLYWSGELPPGNHGHYFLVDGTRYPESGEFEGPFVGDMPPPELEGASLSEGEGGPGTEFTFSVDWVRNGHGEPLSVELLVDGVSYPMNEGTDDVFAVTLILPEGDHEHHFSAAYPGGTVRYPSSGDLEGPEVYYPEIRDSGQRSIGTDGDRAEYELFIEFRSRSGSPDGVFLELDGERYGMTDSEGSPQTSITYSIRLELEEGTYGPAFLLEYGEVTVEEELDPFEVVIEDETDDDDQPGPSLNDDDGSASLIVFVFVGVLLAAAVGAFLLWMRKKRDGEPVEYEYEYEKEDRFR